MAKIDTKSKKPIKQVTPADSGKSYATPALDKGLDILELLSHQRDGLTKSEIARSLQRTVSEIFRMLLCLERRGYIMETPSDRYVLSLRLFQMVQEHPPTERLLSESLSRMHGLVERIGQSCHLGVLESGRVVILAQTNAPGTVGFYVKAGSSIDMMETASGQAILAYLPREAGQRALQEWQKVTGAKVPAELPRHLERIRRRGYEKRVSYRVKGITNISCPILDAQGRGVAALTVPYIQHLHTTISIAETELAIVEAAREISAAIGAH
jgi:DNA-binding IclR family transcriptional regulator